MASVRITAEFADGDNVEVCIEDDNPSPDCLDHMRRQAVDAFHSSLASMFAIQTADD